MAPALSIVICTRNRASQLRGTLDSLAALEGHDWEVVIVDNASTDDTASVIGDAAARDPRLRYVFGERIGLGAARNAGWVETRAPIISFTDDDCYVARDYARAMIAAFAEFPQIGFLGGRVLLHDPDDLPVTIDTRETPEPIPALRFAAAGSVQGANFAFRRSTLERIGGFDDGFGAGTPFPCEDIDAVAAALWAGVPGRYDPRPLIYHHHGRREADLPKLMNGYDKGRGAYYLKYLMRGDTRRAFARGWLGQLKRTPARERLPQLGREIESGLAYVDDRHGGLARVAAAVPLGGLYAATWAATRVGLF